MYFWYDEFDIDVLKSDKFFFTLKLVIINPVTPKILAKNYLGKLVTWLDFLKAQVHIQS